jgi:type II secretory pathway component GspD/PulD (secretin)
VLFGGFILDTRTFDTEIAVDDGQTLVLGGIMRQQEVEHIRRVPILGHLPVLDLIFAKKDKLNEVTELVAFITPKVLRNVKDDWDATSEAGRKLEGVEGWVELPDRPDDSSSDDEQGKSGLPAEKGSESYRK